MDLDKVFVSEVKSTTAVSGLPWHLLVGRFDDVNRKGNKMAGTWKVVAKDGDSKYTYNSKTGKYDYKTTDYVEELDDFALALQRFLEWVDPEYSGSETKVSLVFVPKKNKGKNK